VAFIEDDEVVSVAGVGATPVEVVVAVLGLALMEPVALVDVSVPVVALGLVDSVLVEGTAGTFEPYDGSHELRSR